MGRGRPSRAERRHCSHARSRRRDCARHRHRGRRARARVVAAQVRGPSTRLNRGVAHGESDAAFLEREGSRLGFRRLRQERLLVAAHRRRGERASCGRPRHGVIAFTGLWSDPRAGATTSACVSSEPQVWLLGYAPVTYWAEDRLMSELRVVPAPGYQIVVMTGTIRRRLVVADNMKVAVIQMPATALTPTPTPPPKPPVIQTPPPYVPHYTPAPAMPETTKPVGFELPQECLASAPTHSEGTLSSSTSWVVSCPDMSTAQLPTLMKRAHHVDAAPRDLSPSHPRPGVGARVRRRPRVVRGSRKRHRRPAAIGPGVRGTNRPRPAVAMISPL